MKNNVLFLEHVWVRWVPWAPRPHVTPSPGGHHPLLLRHQLVEHSRVTAPITARATPHHRALQTDQTIINF